MYTFLKSADRYEHRDNPMWWAVSSDRIESLAVSDSYDQFGQKISPSDAGDYLDLISDAAVSLANEIDANYGDVEYEDEAARPIRFKLHSVVSAFDDHDIFSQIVEKLEEGRDYRLEETQFEGFNFWDGSNFKTIVVSSFDDNNTHEIEEDESIIARLNAALENGELVSEGFGTKTFRYQDAEIKYSQFQAAWEYAEITLDNERNND